jgi:EAL domain-containing protein (putative c-di-GMP-specific phosphodiesterase class I)
VFINCSIGVSLFPHDGHDAHSLLRNAAIALRRVKSQGRNAAQRYNPLMNNHSSELLALDTDLHRALTRGELKLYYQPQIDLQSGAIIGLEALLRWRHPRRGLVPPAQFIPLAEATGLITALDEWALRTACDQAKAWQAMGLAGLRIAVNLSSYQFLRAALPERIAQILVETGLDSTCLTLELTESLLIQDVEQAVIISRQLKEMGIQLAIDDFGIGYSSLNYLKRFPIDCLKIDRSFVNDITTDPDDAMIAAAIIAIAHSLQLSVIAEGVETAEQLSFLRAQGCDAMQGYYFSRPLPVAQVTALLQQKLQCRHE